MTHFTSAALERLARSHGITSVAELLDCGLSREQVKSLRRHGGLVPVLRGVYRMPAVADSELARCGAVCRARDDLVIAGPTAGRLWGFRQLPRDARVHVFTSPHAQPTIASWVVPHRTTALRPSDCILRPDGIRVLSRLRSAADMARFDISNEALGSILEQAVHDGRHVPDDLRKMVFDWRSPNRRWVQRVLDVLGDRVPGGAAESHAEFLVGEALVAAGLDGLVRQHRVDVAGFGRVRFDLAVPEMRWAIEVDVFPTHHETAGRRADALRDRATVADGWSTTRLGPDDLGDRLDATVQRLRRLYDERRR